MFTEELVEGADLTQECGVNPGPAVIIEVVGKEFHFDESFAKGVEVAAGIAAEVLDLTVNRLGEVSRA